MIFSFFIIFYSFLIFFLVKVFIGISPILIYISINSVFHENQNTLVRNFTVAANCSGFFFAEGFSLRQFRIWPGMVPMVVRR